MQVITGKYRGRKLLSLDTEKTRPTLARVKESLFSMVDEYIFDSTVLDLFAGSGALGIEAISRGAKKVYFVDNNKDAKVVIEKNLKNVKEDFSVEISDFASALDKYASLGVKFDMIFMDPPYKSDFAGRALELLDKKNLLHDGSIVCLEFEGSNRLQSFPECYIIKKHKTHGIAGIVILEYKK